MINKEVSFCDILIFFFWMKRVLCEQFCILVTLMIFINVSVDLFKLCHYSNIQR